MTSQSRPAATTLRIDTTKRHQTFTGFGASGAWWPNWVSRLEPEKQDFLLDLLYTDRGAALEIYRYNIPAGWGMDVTDPLRRTVDLEIDPFVYDWAHDEHALRPLRGVRERGVEQFVLFANSPPARMTKNGLVSGGDGGGSNLKPESRGDFARYLCDVAEHLKKDLGLPHVALSPVNEPMWDWGKDRRHQEGCHYSPDETALAVRATADEMLRRKLDVRLEAPEAGSWESARRYIEPLLADPVISDMLEEVAIHSYWSNADHKRTFVEWFRHAHPQRTVAMTEYCQMEHGHDLSIDGGLHMARVICDDLTIADVITWQWWLGIAAGGYKDGLLYAHPETGDIDVPKRLWCMANFSRYIRNGAIRLATQVTSLAEDRQVRAVAFIDPADEVVSAVIVNDTEHEVPVELARDGRAARPFEARLTDADHNFTEMDMGETAGAFVLSPKRSVLSLRLRP